MSPHVLPFRAVRRYLLKAALWAVLAALVYPWTQFPRADDLAYLAPAVGSAACLGCMALCLGIAVAGAVQALPLLRYPGGPEALLDKLKADLDSPERGQRRLALQVLADYYGQPFGVISCWPGWFYSRSQLGNMIFLYKEWLQISGDAANGGMLAPHILRRLNAPIQAVIREQFCEGSGLHAPPPAWNPGPLSAEQLAAALRDPIEEAMRDIAHALNQSPPSRLIASSEKRIRDVLADLLWATLKTGVRLRTMTLPAMPAPQPIDKRISLLRRVEEKLDRANEAVKEAILDVGIPDDGMAPDPARRPLPPVQAIRLAAALREQVEETLAAVAERVNAARDLEGVAASDKEIGALFDSLATHALELAAGMRVDAAAEKLPWTAAQGEWAKKLRRMTVLERTPDAERVL